MTDLHHETQLPTIARLLDDLFNIARTFIEAKSLTGETADLISVIERGGEWPVSGERYYPGQSLVLDYKKTVSDLRHDPTKPWRDPMAYALGDWRMYAFHKDGEPRPKHVDEACGFGVMMFDDQDAEIVRAPQKFHRVNYTAQTALIVRLMSKEALQGKDAPSSSRRGITKHTANKYVTEAVKLLEQGPLTTGQIRGLIEYPGTATKLAAELRRCDKVLQDSPGGNWNIKDEVAA